MYHTIHTHMSDTKIKILEYIRQKERATTFELARSLGLSRQAIHGHLNDLLDKQQIVKIGKSPKVYYQVFEQKLNKLDEGAIPLEQKSLIGERFLNITPSGEFMEGVEGFLTWCHDRGLSVDKTVTQYIEVITKHDSYKKNGYIDGMYKLKKTFSEVFLEKIYYLDFYAIEIFGKTKLGQILLYAKQSQDLKMINRLINEIRPKILKLIELERVEAVGFVPPTVKREIQLMKELQRGLGINLPIIKLEKIKTQVTVPQKTLTKLSDRILNAEHTLISRDTRSFDKVLLIDDALGSGATLNEMARKLKKNKNAKEVVGLAITGSFSGFEIISEV